MKKVNIPLHDKIRVEAIDKETGEIHERIMTYGKYKEMNRKHRYLYRAYQI